MYAVTAPSLIGFAGDMHGKMSVFEHVVSMLLNRGVTTIIQVGDFWLYDDARMLKKLDRVIDRVCPPGLDKSTIRFIFIDGNHEDYRVIKPSGDPVAMSKYVTYMPRGTVMTHNDTRIVFFGGASSTDTGHREEGKSWWPDENITEDQFTRALGLREHGDILVTHDTDTETFSRLCETSSHARSKNIDDPAGDKNRGYISRVKDASPVSLHVHGHHHTAARNGTTVSLALEKSAGAVVILDTDTSELYSPVYRSPIDGDWKDDEKLC